MKALENYSQTLFSSNLYLSLFLSFARSRSKGRIPFGCAVGFASIEKRFNSFYVFLS